VGRVGVDLDDLPRLDREDDCWMFLELQPSPTSNCHEMEERDDLRSRIHQTFKGHLVSLPRIIELDEVAADPLVSPESAIVHRAERERNLIDSDTVSR
jgi:hypothetical protein